MTNRQLINDIESEFYIFSRNEIFTVRVEEVRYFRDEERKIKSVDVILNDYNKNISFTKHIGVSELDETSKYANIRIDLSKKEFFDRVKKHIREVASTRAEAHIEHLKLSFYEQK